MEERYHKRGYLLEDYRLFYLNDAQGMKIDYHYHEFCKILFLQSGSGGYCIGEQRYTLEAGDVVLIDSGCIHRPEFESGMPYERTIIYLDPLFLKRQSVQGCDLTRIFCGEHGHVLRPDAQLQKGFQLLIRELRTDAEETGFGQELLRNATLLKLLVYIGRCQESFEVNVRSLTQSNSRIFSIQQFIEAHLDEDLSIDVIADNFFVSKYHMMRMFRRETGVSMHSYVVDRRLFLARERIRQGMSATESCYRSGFKSYSSFTRAYSKRFGTTPTGRADRSVCREETFE